MKAELFPMKISDRARLYHGAFPKFPPLATSGDDYMYGMWKIGNDYTNHTSYYGAYPHNFLKRLFSMFPDISPDRTLHLFSGSVEEKEGVRIDINPDNKPDYVGNAHELSQIFENGRFDLIMADPPYSEEDALHYGTPMVNRNKVVKECAKILPKGGFLVWLDQVLPMYRKDELQLVGEIGVVRSTNHRVRAVFIWRKH